MYDKKKETQNFKKKLGITVACVLVGAAALCANIFYLHPTYNEHVVDLQNLSNLTTQIDQVQDENNSYLQQIEASGKSFDDLEASKETYTSYLGNISIANSLNINKMTVEDVQSAGDQINGMKVEIELQGNLVNVKNFVQELYESPMVGRVNKFSYRLQNDSDLQWMWRAVDDETLVDWWKLDNPDETKEKDSERKTVTANDLMKHGTALCYMEVEFLGTGV